jgi:Leucine-rich repeat (LRR) protein
MAVSAYYRKPLSVHFKKSNSKFDGSRISVVGQDVDYIDFLPKSIATHVKVLFLSDNKITSLDNIAQFENLEVLSLANNNIRFVDQLSVLSLLKNLRKVSLEGNAVTRMPFYREILLRNCVYVTHLDGVQIEPQSHKLATEVAVRASIIYEQLRENELRNCILAHIKNLLNCQAELRRVLSGRYR